jgi:hypothetical protein
MGTDHKGIKSHKPQLSFYQVPIHLITLESIAAQLVKNQFVLQCDTNFHNILLEEAYSDTDMHLSQCNINLSLSGCTSNILLFA